MYAKLFESFWNSSLNLNEDYPTRLAFQWFFTFADPETGFVRCVNAKALAKGANIQEGEAEEAIRVLSGPDPDSSNPEHEGRRIEKVQGGFIVLNGPAYRKLRDLDMVKEQTRLRTIKYREKKRGEECDAQSVTEASQSVTPASASASVSDSVSLKRKKLTKETVWADSPFFEFVKFQEGLSDWSEEKVKYYHNLFTERDAMKPGKYKYGNWCIAARSWDRRDPWKGKENQDKTLDQIWGSGNAKRT